MQLNILNQNHILSLLDWNDITALIKRHAHFKKTVSERILRPLSKEEIELKLKQTSFFLKHSYDDQFKKIQLKLQELNSDESCYRHVCGLDKGEVLSLEKLNELCKLLEFAFSFKKSFSLFEYPHELNIHHYEAKTQRCFLKEFRSFVDTDGSFDYLKHPELRNIYQQQIDTELKLRQTIQIELSRWSNEIQFESFDILNDHHVIPIKTSAFKKEIGKIIARSESGQTLYVEPVSIRNLNFQRMNLVIELQQKIEDLTRKFSLFLQQISFELKSLWRFCLYLDEFFCRSQYASQNNYELIKIDDKKFSIKNAFHPLIDNPVKNTIELKDKNGLIISGPNTGGKTISLKTIALISIFSRFGLACPCTQTSIPFFTNIYYFGNDQQNLSQGLSSFSGEVKTYNDAIESLGENNLIIIDEIFNSTSSEEASALALAFFKQIHKKAPTKIIVSTHHQMLKSHTQLEKHYISAHVGFNEIENRPTYKLNLGIPGASQALKIYSRLSNEFDFAKQIFQDAKNYLDIKHINYESLLNELSQKESELDKILSENRQINQRLKNQEAANQAALKLKLEQKLQQAQKKIKSNIDKAYDQLKKSKTGKHNKKEISLVNHQIQKDLQGLAPKQKTNISKEYANLSYPKELKIGQQYFCTQIKQTITLQKIDSRKQLAFVSKGIMKLNVPIDTLRLGHGKEKKISVKQSSLQYHSEQLEYDCRGMRLEEFQSLVESNLAALFSESIPYLTFIHGHGSGVLKSWIRNFIKSHKGISYIPSANGNDGETTIKLNQ